jgi:16S rRNA C1402 N4-methylase RsmH
VYAIDRDPSTFRNLAPSLGEFQAQHRLTTMLGPFSRMKSLLPEHILFDGIVFDLGVSSMQVCLPVPSDPLVIYSIYIHTYM